jgi:hypothetical protein
MDIMGIMVTDTDMVRKTLPKYMVEITTTLMKTRKPMRMRSRRTTVMKKLMRTIDQSHLHLRHPPHG